MTLWPPARPASTKTLGGAASGAVGIPGPIPRKIDVSSCADCSGVTPGLRRAMTSIHVVFAAFHGPGPVDPWLDARSANVTSGAKPTFVPTNPRGSTPTIVYDVPLTVTCLPRTDGSPPKR